MMGPNWNEQAATYDQFVFCELDDTMEYLEAIGLTGKESVLDVCCGPGRISVAAATRGCDVVGIDSAEKMLERANENAAEYGVEDKCKFRLLDWNRVLVGQNLDKADVVIASRCHAMMDIEKLSSLAREKVMVQIFADAPSIPALKGVLFDGCGEPMRGPEARTAEEAPASGGVAGFDAPQGGPGMPGGPGMIGGPAGVPRGPRHLFPPNDMRNVRSGSAYLDVVLRAYLHGYNPNVRIMPERFIKIFKTKQEAIEWICSLESKRSEGHEDRVALNAEPFLTEVEEGIEFRIATKAAIIWWEVQGE